MIAPVADDYFGSIFAAKVCTTILSFFTINVSVPRGRSYFSARSAPDYVSNFTFDGMVDQIHLRSWRKELGREAGEQLPEGVQSTDRAIWRHEDGSPSVKSSRRASMSPAMIELMWCPSTDSVEINVPSCSSLDDVFIWMCEKPSRLIDRDEHEFDRPGRPHKVQQDSE